MLLSTLPDLPGRTYDVKGVVYDHGYPRNEWPGLKRPNFLEKMFSSIKQQAFDMGADAIIDIKITNDHFPYVIIGTAVKLR